MSKSRLRAKMDNFKHFLQVKVYTATVRFPWTHTQLLRLKKITISDNKVLTSRPSDKQSLKSQLLIKMEMRFKMCMYHLQPMRPGLPKSQTNKGLWISRISVLRLTTSLQSSKSMNLTTLAQLQLTKGSIRRQFLRRSVSHSVYMAKQLRLMDDHSLLGRLSRQKLEMSLIDMNRPL